MSPACEAAAEAWERTLARIPTCFGRLAHMASLRDPNTGVYVHHGLAERIGESDADAVLRRSHMAAFTEWLRFGLRIQKDEVDAYFSGIEGNRRAIIANWLTLEPYAGWIPAESRDVERKLFYSDLSAVLELIRTEYGVSSPDPDS